MEHLHSGSWSVSIQRHGMCPLSVMGCLHSGSWDVSIQSHGMSPFRVMPSRVRGHLHLTRRGRRQSHFAPRADKGGERLEMEAPRPFRRAKGNSFESSRTRIESRSVIETFSRTSPSQRVCKPSVTSPPPHEGDGVNVDLKSGAVLWLCSSSHLLVAHPRTSCCRG